MMGRLLADPVRRRQMIAAIFAFGACLVGANTTSQLRHGYDGVQMAGLVLGVVISCIAGWFLSRHPIQPKG